MPVTIYKPLKTPCSKSQATSSLIKSIRLRRLEDSVYWLVHLYHYFPELLYILNRRALIIFAEDNSSMPLQMEIAEWYSKFLSNKSPRAVMESLLPLIFKICHTKNWYAQADTQTYILGWRLAEKVVKHRHQTKYQFDFILDSLLQKLESADRKKKFPSIAAMHFAIKASSGYKGVTYAYALRELAKVEKLEAALNVASIHVRYTRDLTPVDDNYLGHALYRVCGFGMGDQAIPDVDETALESIFTSAYHEVRTSPRMGPSWALDGIHTSGGDSRFAGALPSMVGCCNAFNRTGKLDPNQPWVKSDWSSFTLYETLKPPYDYVS